MKIGMFGCLAGSVAALLFAGCAAEHRTDYVSAAPVYRSTHYAATSPIFVERRAIVVDNQRRVVPIYRTGDSYFYTYGGRQFALTDYPTVRRTTTTFVRPRTAYVGASYRDVNLDDDYTERTLVPIAESPAVTTTTTVVRPETEVVTEFTK